MNTDLGPTIVTGGSSGLGAAIVSALERAGATPIVIDLQPPRSDVECDLCDLADSEAAERATAAVIERHPDIAAVVTCAGVDTPGRCDFVDRRDWERVIAVNLFGTAAVVRAALPTLIANRGRVVTVASTLGHRVCADATAYCASKWGVVGFTRALAAETKGELGVTLLTPGGMDTAFFDGRSEDYRPGPDAQLAAPQPVADAVLFALQQPVGIEIKELVIAGPTETSWP